MHILFTYSVLDWSTEYTVGLYRMQQAYAITTVESRFFEPPRDTKMGSKIRRVRESGVKLQCSTEEVKTL